MNTFDAAIFMQDWYTNTYFIQQNFNNSIERHELSAFAWMYHKYNKDLSRDVEIIIKNNNNSNDNVNILTSNDMKYLISVTIDEQSMNVQIDIDSSDLWVFSTHLFRAEQKNHKIYDSFLFNIFKTSIDEIWISIYDDEFQNASENVCIDVVTVETSIVQNQIIQLAAKLSSQILNHISFSDQSSYASCIFVLSFKLTECKKSLILILKVSILFNQINRTSSLTMSKVVSLH